MPEKTELIAQTAFETPQRELRIAAVDPAEWHDDVNHSYLLRIDRSSASVVEEPPYLFRSSWQAKHGEVYFPVHAGKLVRPRPAKQWAESQICERNEPFKDIHGVSGAKPEDDALFVLSDTALFVRRPGADDFEEHALPDDVEMPHRLHGVAADEIYIGAEVGLLRWDGAAVGPMEGPEEEIKGVLVTAPDEMFVVGDTLHRFRDGEGWRAIDVPSERISAGLTVHDGALYLATLDGIVKVDGVKATLEDDFRCNGIYSIGGQLIAKGGRGGIKVLERGKWVRIPLPEVAARS